MKSRLTIAGRVNVFVTGLALVTALVVVSYAMLRGYQANLQRLIDEATWYARDGVQHELAFYYKDRAKFAELLQRLSRHDAVVHVAAYGLSGERLASITRPGGEQFTNTKIADLRDGLRQLEVGVAEPPLLSGGGGYIDISVPVFAGINPLKAGVSRAGYGQRLTSERATGSSFLTGYYHLGVSRDTLIASTVPRMQESLLHILAYFVFAIGLTALFTTSIRSALSGLATMANEVSKGNFDKKFASRGIGEIKDITSALNVIIKELKKYKNKMETDSHLLRMKVSERTEQLSEQNRRLNAAVQQVTKTKNKLRQMAYYDSLTELPNRQLFTEQLELLLRLAQREGRTIALLFLDLDNFKRINDSLGHTAGDLLLRQVAARLSTCVRESDLLAKYVETESKIGVARLGGDEFTVVLNNIDRPETAAQVAERILDTLQKPMMIEGHEVVVTPSVGIALAPQDGDNVEELLKLADTAMYHAKTEGRNKYSFYRKSMKGTGIGRLKLESELRKAVEREELILHYQPQVCARTGSIMGAEALVRWEHPKHGLIPPVRFIPLAEELGLIVDIGTWALEEAARQCKRFQKLSLEVPKIAVNISALQFNKAFTSEVERVLDEADLDPSLIELELTEGVIMSNAKASIEALHSLKQLGVSLSVDDFGTGYSSLSYLSAFPLDELKIDRSFVVEFNKNKNSMSLVSTIIAMGKSLGLTLVAEGVDNVDQFVFLRDRKVETIQGYLFSKPVPQDDFTRLVQENPFPQQIEDMLRKEAEKAKREAARAVAK